MTKSSYNIIVAEKSLICSSSCSIYGILGKGVGWLKSQNTIIWGSLKLFEKPSYDIWTFP